ncbi:MAG: HNH endonuclease family protein, partial [uncultured Thermomicrobiales bacterium]
ERSRPGPEPELRTAERLQRPPRHRARLRRQGRGAGDPRPRRQLGLARLPVAVGHPDGLPHPPAAAAGQADPQRGLHPRRVHLPVLRPPGRRPDDRPRRAEVARRRPLLGQPRLGLQALQPPQGRPPPERGADEPPPRPARAAGGRLLHDRAAGRRLGRGRLVEVPARVPADRADAVARPRTESLPEL